MIVLSWSNNTVGWGASTVAIPSWIVICGKSVSPNTSWMASVVRYRFRHNPSVTNTTMINWSPIECQAKQESVSTQDKKFRFPAKKKCPIFRLRLQLDFPVVLFPDVPLDWKWMKRGRTMQGLQKLGTGRTSYWLANSGDTNLNYS